MDAKDLRTESALSDLSNDGNTKYAQSSAVLQCNRNKPYQDIGSNSLAKVDVQTSRPCAVIGPDRVVPPPISTDAYLKKGPPEPWMGADIYRRPPEYPHKISDYQHPTRNISPRQTFQENMQRIMVPPSFNSVKLKEDHNFLVNPNIATLRQKINMPTEVKYCDVPYPVNPLTNEQKSVRNADSNVSNMNPTLARSAPAPQGWPAGNANVRPLKPYIAPELYQYPEYSSCAGPRPMLTPRTHRTVHEETGHVYSDPYYQEASIRFKPYPPPVKERFPQARYEYIGNYSNPFHPPPFPSQKYDSQKPVPAHPYPGYSQAPLKYLEPRMAEPVMNGYQRPLNQQTNFNTVPFRNHIIHPSYGPVPGNCLQTNKFYPYPPDNTKTTTSNKLPYDTNNKFYAAEYENTRPKPYPLPDSFYVNEVSRSHPIKGQVLPPNYPSVNLQATPTYPYYRKENLTMKNYEFSPHYRNIDPSMNVNVNSLSRFPSQFSPNTIAISPSDSNTSNDTTHTQTTVQEDYGYVSQSSSTSIRSMDSGINRIPNDFYRRYDYRYGPFIRASPLLSRPEVNPNNNIGSKNKKEIDVRQFLQMWNESEDENGESNNKEITSKSISAKDITNRFEASAKQEQLYVLGLVNVPSEELSKYEHIQKVSKLPENIKGYNSIELLNQFEEVIGSSNLNNFNVKPPIQRETHVSLKSSMLHGIRIPQRPISPLDVEAKISQSVIHKEVGCNFEIRPCSPKMLNVEVATPAQNVLGERVIEKVSNPLILSSPILGNVDENMDTCNVVKHQDHRISPNENTKTSSCKMNSTQYNPSDSVKTNYSLQDLESSSGVCLASLPRLDNDIELNFPEVNQQFINANKVDSVITSAPKDLPTFDVDQSNTVQDREVQAVEIRQFPPNVEFEKEFSKLSKYRKLKRKGSESKENTPEPNAQAMRTNSVIIKNPENNKSHEEIVESCLPIKTVTQDSQQNPINLSVQERIHYTRTDPMVNEIINDSTINDIAIDFSLNSNDHCKNKANLSLSDETFVSIEKHSSMPHVDPYSDNPNNIKVNVNEFTKVIEDSNESSKCVKQTNFETDTQVVGGTNSLSNNRTEASSSSNTAKSVKSDSNLISDNSKEKAESVLHTTNSSNIEECLINEDSSSLNAILGSPACVSVAMESVMSDNVNSEKDVLFRDRKCKQNTSEAKRSDSALNDKHVKIENKSTILMAKNECNFSGTTIETENADGISLHFCNKQIYETESKAIAKMQSESHNIDESMCQQLPETKEKICNENETSPAHFSKILCRVNKELFSPRFQKLVLFNEGLCTSNLSTKYSSDSLFPETSQTIMETPITTPFINKTTENDTIDSTVENLENKFSDQDMVETTSTLGIGGRFNVAIEFISDKIKNNCSSIFMSTNFKDDPGVDDTDISDATCKPQLQNNTDCCSDETIIDNKKYISNNTRNYENVNVKMGINISVHEEIDNNICMEFVHNTTKESNSEITATNTCSTISHSYVNNHTTELRTDLETKLNIETDPCVDDLKIDYSCLLSKTSENYSHSEDKVDGDNTTQELIMKSTETNHTTIDDTLKKTMLEAIKTDSCVVDSSDSAKPISKSTESDFCVKDTKNKDSPSRELTSEGKDHFEHKASIDSLSVKSISKVTTTDPCDVAREFDISSSNPTSLPSETDNCTENSIVDNNTTNELITDTAETFMDQMDDVSSDFISEPTTADYSEPKEMDIDNMTINSFNNLIPKSPETHFSIDVSESDNSTQEQFNSEPTNSMPHVDNKLNSKISKTCEPVAESIVDNTIKELNSLSIEFGSNVINTSNELILQTTEDQSSMEDTSTISSQSTEIETLVNDTTSKPKYEGTETDFNVVYPKSNKTTNQVNFEADPCVDDMVVEGLTKKQISSNTEISNIVDNIEIENKTNNFISATDNKNSCSDSSPARVTDPLVDQTVVENTTVNLVSDVTEANLLVEVAITTPNLEDVCSDLCIAGESMIIANTRESVLQVLAGDNCNENITCEENENIPENIHSDVNKTVELNSNQNTYDTIAELNKFNSEEDSSICQIRYDELEAELDNSNLQHINGFDAQRQLFPFINDTDSELKCVVNLKDVSSYRCEEPDTKLANKFKDIAEEATIDVKHRNDTDSADNTSNSSTIDENVYDAAFETPQELLEYCKLKQNEIDTCDAIPLNKSQLCDPFKYMRYENNHSIAKKRGSLKRSLSDSALYTCNVDFIDSSKHEDSETGSLLWPNKRKKLIESENSMARHYITEGYCNIVHHNRRNSISAMYNEENVSFCILIDDNCIITEEDDEADKICFTDIPEDCISCVPNDATNTDENTQTEISPNEEINCEYSDTFALECAEDEKSLVETWVDDVACVETVISDDIAEDIIVSASTSPRETDLSDESNNNETSIFDGSDHTDKVKYIYGDTMCSNDAQLLETLYRTPQMDVNKTLIYKESQGMDDCNRYYDKQTLEEVLSESSTLNKTAPSKLSGNDLVTSIFSPDTINARNRLDAKDNLDLDNFKSCSSPLECRKNQLNIISEMKCEKNKEEAQIVVKTQDDTVHSCESSVDNVFSYNQHEERPICTISSSPEVTSTTTEEKNASILLKITNYMGSRTAQVSNNSVSKRNTVCCKYTENKEYINFNTNLPSRPLLTKAAQKYIPPLKETIRDLKVKLPLPPHSLIKLKQLKISKEEPKPNVKINNDNIGRKEIPKKTKPKFEDVLKSIDEIQFQMHKEKSKKIKKSIPKVVIKKNENGSHYASTSSKDKYNPDLTGRKWQPWVFIERNSFIDKMAIEKKTKAIFNHRKNKFVLAETFKKYRSIGSAKFVISHPRIDDSSLGQLKYTIKLKHTY